MIRDRGSTVYLCGRVFGNDRYYHTWRTHLSLDMDAPESRLVQPPELGPVRKRPDVGGLHHHYERIAA
jgi:hypothetical protein